MAPVTSQPRTLTPDDLEAAWLVLENAFGGPTAPADRDVELGLVDAGRCYATYDGASPVAVAGSFALTMTVPGGPAPVAGVTWVGVAPTHRRRGLLTGLMRRQLDDLRAGGEAVAALWASEGAIYQRFGYGPAAWDAALTLPSKAAFTRPVPTSGLRLAEPDPADLGPVFEQVAARSTGWCTRTRRWWDYRLHDPEQRRSGASPLRVVLADGPGGVAGYALYATKQEWEHGRPSGAVEVRELVGIDPETTAKLWRYLLDLDLMTTVRTHISGPDDPVLHLLAEPRAASARLKDNLWVRLVDVPAALAARRYPTEVDLVLDVTDDFCPWNRGRWHLVGGPTGATCTAAAGPADLELRVADLGAAYLGGTTLAARAGAGHVLEHRAGALAAATLAFGWPGRAPYGPMVF